MRGVQSPEGPAVVTGIFLMFWIGGCLGGGLLVEVLSHGGWTLFHKNQKNIPQTVNFNNFHGGGELW